MNIPTYFLKKHYSSDKILYPNLERDIEEELPKFYKQIIKLWSEIAYNEPII